MIDVSLSVSSAHWWKSCEFFKDSLQTVQKGQQNLCRSNFQLFRPRFLLHIHMITTIHQTTTKLSSQSWNDITYTHQQQRCPAPAVVACLSVCWRSSDRISRPGIPCLQHTRCRRGSGRRGRWAPPPRPPPCLWSWPRGWWPARHMRVQRWQLWCRRQESYQSWNTSD